MLPARLTSSIVLAAVLLTSSLAVADVPTVANPVEPPARATTTLREAWRAGGEDDSEILLGKVGVAISGPDGTVYALDSQLSEIQVFDREGAHLRTVGREGEGPGEFRQPVGLFLTSDGALAVQQAFPGKVTFVDRQTGVPRDTWELGGNAPESGGFGFIETARERGGTFAVSAATSAFDMTERKISSTNFLAVIDDAGNELVRLAELVTARSMVAFTVDELAEYYPGERGNWDIAPDGSIYLVPRYDSYEIAVHAPDGTLQRTFTREHEARLRTEEEKADKRSSMQMNINGMEPEIEWKLQDRVQSVERIQVLDDGTVWVRNSHARANWDELGIIVYDVFDPDGRLLREVTVTLPGGGEGDRPLLLDDGRFLLVKGMESLSVSVNAGNDDEAEIRGEDLGDTLLELVCFEPVR